MDALPPPLYPPGWYDDPERPGSLRYWKGAKWTDPTEPGWKEVDQSFLWWNGEEYTVQAQWGWAGSKWALYHWDGAAATSPLTFDPRRDELPSARPPGWPRPRASRKATASMIGLIICGCVALVLGPTLSEEKECFPDSSVSSGLTYTDVAGLWLPWLALVVLALVGWAVRERLAPGVRWIKVASTLGVTAAVLTFPGFLWMIGGMNCAL